MNVLPGQSGVGCPRGVVVKAMNCGIVVSEFVFQSRYYFHFRLNTLGKGMNPLSSQLWVKQYHYCSSRRMALTLNKPKKVDMPLNKETKPMDKALGDKDRWLRINEQIQEAILRKRVDLR